MNTDYFTTVSVFICVNPWLKTKMISILRLMVLELVNLTRPGRDSTDRQINELKAVNGYEKRMHVL